MWQSSVLSLALCNIFPWSALGAIEPIQMGICQKLRSFILGGWIPSLPTKFTGVEIGHWCFATAIVQLHECLLEEWKLHFLTAWWRLQLILALSRPNLGLQSMISDLFWHKSLWHLYALKFKYELLNVDILFHFLVVFCHVGQPVFKWLDYKYWWHRRQLIEIWRMNLPAWQTCFGYLLFTHSRTLN